MYEHKSIWKRISTGFNINSKLRHVSIFPTYFFEFIENEDKVWKLLILLQEVVDIIYASKFTKPMLKYFEELYVEFMTNFVPLYSGVSICPKMNFIVHLPSIIRKNGAPENSSVLNYEG